MDVTRASQIAAEIHQGQRVWPGLYIDHVAELARHVTMDARAGVDHIVVAWLQGVIRDSGKMIAELPLHECSNAQLMAVFSITQLGSEVYTAYITRCALNPIAALVKLHLVEMHLAKVLPEKLLRKYCAAHQELLRAVQQHHANGAYAVHRPSDR